MIIPSTHQPWENLLIILASSQMLLHQLILYLHNKLQTTVYMVIGISKCVTECERAHTELG